MAPTFSLPLASSICARDGSGPVILARGFRPFFLLAAVHGGVFVPVWASMWTGVLAPPGWLDPFLWHAHEMLFGFVAAAVAGFLLTAVPVWTGLPALQGGPLGALAGLWIAGRLAFALAGWLPPLAVAAIDVPFLPVLAAVLARSLLREGQRHNQVFLGVLLVWSLANLAWHAEAAGAWGDTGRALAALSVHSVLVILVVVAGRIVPLFTANALRRSGDVPGVRSWPPLDRASVIAVSAVLALDVAALAGVAPGRGLATALPAVAAGLLALRCIGWRGWRAAGDPLVWSLHLGFVWAPIGLALEAASAFTYAVPRVAGLHALGVGAFGGLILAVMSRVALGHTGRALRAPAPMAWAYLGMNAAALVRVLGALEPSWARASVVLAAALWCSAIGLFLWRYAPMLWAPRVDGSAG